MSGEEKSVEVGPEVNSDLIQQFKLSQDEELRFEVAEGKNVVTVTVINKITI